MSTSWYSLSFSSIPPNNYNVNYYFSVANSLVTGFYRYDNIGVNILAPQTLFGNNSGSDNAFTVGTLSFSITQGTNINDPNLYNNVVSGFPSATNYFNIFSTTGTTGRAGIYYFNNTGTNGGYVINRATVSSFATPNIVSIVVALGTAPVITSIIPTSYSSFNVYFNPSTGGTPAPTTYYYSLNGGTTYTNANTTTSPITITGLTLSTNYSVALIATNLAGNTAASNIVAASISYPCFAKGSQILTDGGYTPVEQLHPGDMIQTKNHGFVPIWKLGKKTIHHTASKDRLSHQLYRLSPDRYPALTEPLILTGCHSILIEEWSDDQEKERAAIVHKGDVYITDDRYRLPACADEKAEVHEPAGEYTIYHIALENPDYLMNYGIYANGLLVESCSKRYLAELSGMELLK